MVLRALGLHGAYQTYQQIEKGQESKKGRGCLKPPTAAEKGKAPMPTPPVSKKRKSVMKKKGRLPHGIVIEEPHADRRSTQGQDFLVSDDRINDFQTKDCIGERHVNLGALRSRSAEFGQIVDLANLSPICSFPERTGYCAHLVRTFFINARQLQDVENGPMEFVTMVRGSMTGPSMTGPHYLKARSMTDASWKTVVHRICVPDTPTHGISVLSKELLPEYRFLNFIICYNIQPNMNTKVLRWDRMLEWNCLGQPEWEPG